MKHSAEHTERTASEEAVVSRTPEPGVVEQTASAPDEGAPAGFWRMTAALTCVLVGMYAMNVVVFPLFDDVFTFARDISQLVLAVMALAVGIVATFRPSLLKSAPLGSCVLAFLAFGAVMVPLSLAVGNGALLVVAASVFAVGRGAVLLATSIAMARVLSGRAIVASVALAFVASAALQAACWLVPIAVGLALYCLLPFVIFFLVKRDARAMVDLASFGEAPADAVITRPKSFLPLASQVFVCLFLFRAAFGISLRFGETTGVPVEVFFGIVPIGIAALMLMFWKRFDADRLAQVSVLFVAVGFLFLNSSSDGFRDASNFLLSSGNSLFNMVSWIVIASVGARNLTGALGVAGWGNGVGSLGTIIGAALGVGSNHLVEHSPDALMALSGMLLVLFVGYALIGLKNFSFKSVIEGVVPVEEPGVVAESPEVAFQARCDAIAEEYRLTPREREVFAMLARGRNREYIQEKLVVSRNTVKAHVRHVYEKLGIHSHQELIDLVEDGVKA